MLAGRKWQQKWGPMLVDHAKQHAALAQGQVRGAERDARAGDIGMAAQSAYGAAAHAVPSLAQAVIKKQGKDAEFKRQVNAVYSQAKAAKDASIPPTKYPTNTGDACIGKAGRYEGGVFHCIAGPKGVNLQQNLAADRAEAKAVQTLRDEGWLK
ncbi:hypothetical protein [Streptomyces noursei]